MTDDGHKQRLTVRLLGGFDVHLGDAEVFGFESRKARALFAYLAVHHSQPVSREHLAGLFWPDRHATPARRNLRQALYNIRTTMNGFPDLPDILCSTRVTVQLNPAVEFWLDTEAFTEALRIGLAGDRPDPHQMALAVRLYRGEFLRGLTVQGSTAVEEWLFGEQERLREMAIEALRSLVETYFARGEYRIGLRMALQLVALDPLSEEAHQYLMRLYQMAGRRGRALEHFEEFKRILEQELGVQPAAETQALHKAILKDEMPTAGGERRDQPLAPLLPLVGRSEGLDALARAWRQVRRGRSRVTLVTGETGVGKTRLIRTFLDTAASRSPGLVLQGRGYERAAGMNYQPFAGILAEVLIEDPSVVERALEGHDPRMGHLVRLVAHLSAADPGESPSVTDLVDREEFFSAILAVLRLYTEESANSRGVPSLILFLDDLDRADEPSLEFLDFLVQSLDGPSLWIVASATNVRDRVAGSLVERLSGSASEDRVDVVQLERLTEQDLGEIADSLVGARSSAELAAFLDRHSGRLPLTVAELVNVLWDDGLLEPGSASEWVLRDLPEFAEIPSVESLILRRVARLPNSVRRMLAVAAVAGPKFDTDLLIHAASEHAGVVEIGTEVALERWLVRTAQPFWATPGREADLVLWARGARQGAFEFAHETIRMAILGFLEPRRRREIHRLVAQALEERHRGSLDQVREELAYHWTEARNPRRAAWHMVLAAKTAISLRAESNAVDFCRQALQQIRRPQLTTSEPTLDDLEEVTIEQIESLLARLERDPGLAASG